jgi:hypothetical protein
MREQAPEHFVACHLYPEDDATTTAAPGQSQVSVSLNGAVVGNAGASV